MHAVHCTCMYLWPDVLVLKTTISHPYNSCTQRHYVSTRSRMCIYHDVLKRNSLLRLAFFHQDLLQLVLSCRWLSWLFLLPQNNVNPSFLCPAKKLLSVCSSVLCAHWRPVILSLPSNLTFIPPTLSLRKRFADFFGIMYEKICR